jgi:hypothetical protein
LAGPQVKTRMTAVMTISSAKINDGAGGGIRAARFLEGERGISMILSHPRPQIEGLMHVQPTPTAVSWLRAGWLKAPSARASGTSSEVELLVQPFVGDGYPDAIRRLLPRTPNGEAVTPSACEFRPVVRGGSGALTRLDRLTRVSTPTRRPARTTPAPHRSPAPRGPTGW